MRATTAATALTFALQVPSAKTAHVFPQAGT